jgi:tetratricopeptide (TPR) repeat protein
MSRKIRTTVHHPRPAAPGVAPSLAASARQALAAGRHREAVELHKELLKQERRPEWVDGLAASYAGRAQELTAKGMFAEALVVWRNRAKLCDRPLAEGPYIDCLLRAGEHDTALRLLTTEGSSAAAGDLETRLAAVVLVSPESALSHLAADCPLLRHRGAALAAISACSRGDRTELDERLRAIPFSSPYRDLRFILKALLAVGDDPAQAADLIARVGGEGPFARLAAIVRAAIQPGGGWLTAMRGLDDEGQRLLLDLKGCPESRRPLLFEVAELARLEVPPAPVRVLDLLLRRSRGLPASAARLCRRLLPFADQRLADYRAAFGPLAEVERDCILARAGEIRHDGNAGSRHWLRAAALLSPTTASPLQAALILRHLFAAVVPPESAPQIDSEPLSWLERSLELDPDDRATYLQLIRIHRRQKNLKAARATVDVALTRFADDPAVLLEAVETALAGNAFKKAVTLAKRLLELDPINLRVRALIGQAHLSHARKQIRLSRPDAAGREIDLAEQWLTSPGERSLGKLLRGLCADSAPATGLLREAAGELGGGLFAAFQLLLESHRVGTGAAGVLRRAGVELSGMPLPGEVLAIVQGLNDLGQADQRWLAAILEPLRAPLKRAAVADFSESERISICETFLRQDENALLAAYAGVGLKRSPARPVFVYFVARAKQRSTFFVMLSENDQLALERALEAARAEGDERTVLRIGELMRSGGFFGGADPDDFDDDPFAGDDEEGDALGGLPLDPRAMFEMMISLGSQTQSQLIRMARAVLPLNVFRESERAAGGNRKKLAQLLVECLLENEPAAKPRAEKSRPSADDPQKGLFDD